MARDTTRDVRSSALLALLVPVLMAPVLGGCTRTSNGPGGSNPSSEVDAGALDCSTPREGCPCDTTEDVACLIGPSIRDGQVFCANGTRSCNQGRYSACHETTGEEHMGSAEQLGLSTGALISGPVSHSLCEPRRFDSNDQPDPGDLMAPRATGLEFGNGGAINTGAVNTCSTAACQRTLPTTGPGGTPYMLTPANSDGVSVISSPAAFAGYLTLGIVNISAPGVWVSNTYDGTVSRFDPVTGLEIGRYPSARPDFVNLARPVGEVCAGNAALPNGHGGNCPSRTAIDQNFDFYIANRAFNNFGTVTKIAGRRSACVDRNGNGNIETSTDVSGNGRIEIGNPAEYFGANDECILWTVGVGGRNALPRALAVGVAPLSQPVGDVWVGTYAERRAYRLRPSDGAILGNVSIAPINPYGALADPTGRIWFSTLSRTRTPIGRVTPATMTFQLGSALPSNADIYGIGLYSNAALTEQYLYGAGVYSGQIFRYNLLTNTWLTVNSGQSPRGMAADVNGNVWVAVWNRNVYDASGWGAAGNELWQYDRNLTARVSYTPPGVTGFMGIAASFDGAIWSVSGGNRAVRLSPDRASWVTTPPTLVGPYTYTDFIGYGLNVFANPRGHHNFTSDSQVAGMPTCSTFRWREIRWNTVILPSTAASLYVRTANTTVALATQPWIGPFPAAPYASLPPMPTANVSNLRVAPGPVPAGRFIEIDIRMETTDRSTTPAVGAVTPVGECDEYLYNDPGRYVRVYNSADRCTDNEDSAYWGIFDWDVNMPAGTSVEFEVRAADTEAGLATATPITFPATSNLGTRNIEALLQGANVPIHPRVISVTAVTRASADRRLTPTFYRMGLDYTCVAGM